MMGSSMINGIMLFLVWNSQKKIHTIQWRHITKDKITKRSNGKGDDTLLCDHDMSFILMNPP
jgi:hypothetical protein